MESIQSNTSYTGVCKKLPEIGETKCWSLWLPFGYLSLKTLCSLLPGLQTSEDAKFYALSTRFGPFSNENETLVVQFSVKHEQGIDCGGGYVKLFPDTLNQEDMHSESEYYVMFGKLSDSSSCQAQEVLMRATIVVEKGSDGPGAGNL